MTIDGVYYTEPELMAKFRQMQETIQRLEGENYKLTEKLDEIGTMFNEQVSLVGWHEEREKKYERLLKSAVNVLKTFIPCDEDYCRECQNKALNNNACDYDDHFIWIYLNEALELIGGEGE